MGFCDASTKGYAAVIYFRKETPPGDVQTVLLGSKTRVAPMRLKHDEKQTVPRLLGCFLGCFILSRFMATVFGYHNQVYHQRVRATLTQV